MYGRGESSIADQLGVTLDEAKQLKEDVYKALPKLKEFIEESEKVVSEKGYIKTLWNYKRRLPDFNLPKVQVFYGKEVYSKTDKQNIIVASEALVPDAISDSIIKEYLSIRNFDKREDYIEKLKENRKYVLVDNRSKIAAAQRQIINSAIQGTAANMTKRALLEIYNNEQLNALKCYALIPVHDEIIAVTPYRYAKPASELFAKAMEDAPKEKLEVHIKCDVDIFFNWAGESITNLLGEELIEDENIIID